jgi:Tol biopolymer transport system component
VRHAQLSPDGQTWAFSAFQKIWTMPVSGGAPRRVSTADSSEAMPSWSPDGSKLLFATWQDGGGHIYEADVRTGTVRQITDHPAHYAWPTRLQQSGDVMAVRSSSDDWAAAFLGDRSPPSELVKLSPSGGAATVLRPLGNQRIGRLHQIAGNNRIYFHSSSQGVVSVEPDGGGYRAEFKVRGEKERYGGGSGTPLFTTSSSVRMAAGQ